MIKFDDFLSEQLQHPELAAIHEELTPQYQVVRDLLDLQQARGLGAEELAQKVGVPVDDLYYLEDAGGRLSFSLLYRIARALDARAEIRLSPLEAKMSVPSPVLAST
jgi:transcriptional regulator with XRE-family HTH domain